MMMELDHRMVRAHGFAIMDPCMVEPEHWPDCPRLSLAPRQLTSRAHLLPSLVDLRELSAEHVGDVVDAAARWASAHGSPYFCALITASDGIQKLADGLRLRFIAQPPGSTARTLLRWHDPRVFEHLLRIFRPAQVNHLLRPVSGWTWPNRQGVWGTTSAHREGPVSPAMDDRTWRRLERIAVANRILVESAQFLMEHADAIDVVWRLLDRAHEQHGLTESADCRLFVRQALEFGESIHSHPAVVACLTQARAGDATYVGACSGLGTQHLRAWAQNKHSPRTEHHGV